MSFAQDLRASVLQAAMQGKLTEQLATDTPVGELLADIKAEKDRLIVEKKIKKEKPLSEISDDDIPFDIPENWQWVKMGELVKISTGKRDANYGTDDGKYDFYTCSKIPIKSPTFSFEGECLILPGNGANVGEAYYYDGQFEAYQRTYVLEKHISDFNIRFLEKVLLCNWKQFNANKQFGSAIPYIKLGNLQDFPVPLPPIEEQKRIVRRIDEIMTLIDELEAIEEELTKLKKAFPGDMKTAILQAAMQGKLSEQLDTDSSVDDLLEDIKKEREKLVAEGKVKKSKAQQNNNFVALDDVPFDIPSSWKWVKLGDLLSVISDGTHKTPQYVDKGVPFLSVQNISQGKFTFDKIKYISQEEHNELCKRIKPEKGDILLCRIGTLGKALKNTLDFEFSIFVSLGLLRPIVPIITDFLILSINSPVGYKWIQENKVGGGTHTFKINLNSIPEMHIPLPPIEEQQRIVDKLETILPLIESI